jgi:hypothetical protein
MVVVEEDCSGEERADAEEYAADIWAPATNGT